MIETIKRIRQFEADLHISRAAIFGIFGLNGFILAMWAVHIPSIIERTNISHSTLGLLLLGLGLGAFIGMQKGGWLADKFGSRRMVVMYALWLSLTIFLLGSATNAWQLAIGLFIVGIGNGGLDVTMNLQAAILEDKYKRPIMSAFHAFFSIGTFIGSLVGAFALSRHLDVPFTFTLVTVLGVMVTCIIAPLLVHHVTKKQDRTQSELETGKSNKISKAIHLRVALLGSLAFLLMLSEGVATDWSALQIKETLAVPAAQAALGYAAFAILMTAGRLVADRVSLKFGAIAIIRYGSLLAATGMLIVIVSPWLWLTIIGWGLFGLGLSGSAPQLFTASGKLSSHNQGLIMSRVVGIGYIGLLAGPAVIGWLTHLIPLNIALMLPLVFTLVAAILAKKAVNG